MSTSVQAEYNGLASFEAPLDASDATISEAVSQAALLPLLMAVVHLTGSLDILRQAGRTGRPQFSTDTSGGIPPDRAAALRVSAGAAIRQWRDAGCPPPYAPDEAELRQMIETLAGEALEPHYEALLAEELGFHGDERAFHWAHAPAEAERERLPVLVIGAGLSGLVMAYRLRQAGIPCTVVEKNAGPGGTWFENSFPGARVDVPSHCYSYSFVRDQRWPELFSAAPVLRQYFIDCAERFGLAGNIRYGISVESARWNEADAGWAVVLRSAEGEETLRCKAVVSAVGQLNRPLVPTIEGADTFQGVAVHTSRWPKDLAIAGKRIAVVGTAATALQLIPELAREAAELTVFQRSPTWVLVHPEYRDPITPGQQWALDHLPGFARWYRLILYNWAMDGAPAHMLMDPDWTGGPQAISAANEASRVRLTKGMMEAIGNNPELIEKLIPTYPPYVKRPNIGDGGFFRAFSQSNVHLCTDGIARFAPDGIVDGAGVHHTADIVVYATGFRALEYLAPMEIVGRDGLRLEAFWGDEPRAHLGLTMPHFPNLFLMYGPGTNLGFNGNLFFNAECQARYIAECLRWMAEERLDAIEVRQDVYADYAARMDASLARFAWSHGGAGSWYKNKSGKVIANSPWPLVKYWEWTRTPDRSEFVVTRAISASTREAAHPVEAR